MIETRIFQRDDPVPLPLDPRDWEGYELAQDINISQGSLSDIENVNLTHRLQPLLK